MKSNHHLAKEKIKKITEIICDEKKKAAEELFEKNKITSEDLTTGKQYSFLSLHKFKIKKICTNETYRYYNGNEICISCNILVVGF